MEEMIELGDRVKDKVTKLEGIVVSRVKYLNGCVQFCVQPSVDKEGKIPEYHYIDENQLSIVTKNECVLPQMAIEEGPGGVMRNAPGKQFNRR